MLVTAENKMRDAAEITQSYHGELVQTIRFPFGYPSLADHLQENLDYTRQMLSSLGPPTDPSDGRPDGLASMPISYRNSSKTSG